MADIKAFRATRPIESMAADVAALPYDCFTREEAREVVSGKPHSFLNIDRPETMFPEDTDMYSPEVYEAAADRFRAEKEAGIYHQDETPAFYIYELSADGRTQQGLAALSAVSDYESGTIRRHENTVEVKERDRLSHILALRAQTGPIFLAYRDDEGLKKIFCEWKKTHSPIYDFVSEDGTGQRVFVIDDPSVIEAIETSFQNIDRTYIADGHHRAASAVRAAGILSKEGADPCPYFLSVLFPASELKICDYNRIVRDLNGLSTEEFLKALEESFRVEYLGKAAPESSGADPTKSGSNPAAGEMPEAETIDPERLRPKEKYDFGMCLDDAVYMLHFEGDIPDDPVAGLPVSILQNEVLDRILGIRDPRTDTRISFVSGSKGMKELMAIAAGFSGGTPKGSPAAAFAVSPVGMDELMAVADRGLLMPPKSTWFEPKLRSGLFIHEF